MVGMAILDNTSRCARELWVNKELKAAITLNLVNDVSNGVGVYRGRGDQLLDYGHFVPWRILGDAMQIKDIYDKLGFNNLPAIGDYKTVELIGAGFHLSHIHNEYSVSVTKNYAVKSALFGHCYKQLVITRSNVRGNIYWQAYLEGAANQLRESVRTYSEFWHGDFTRWLADIEHEVMQTYAVRVSDLPTKFYK